MTLPYLLLPFGQLLRWQITPSIAVNGFEVAMVLAILASGFRLQASNLSMWVFSGALTLSWIINPTVNGGLYLARWWLYAWYLIVLWQNLRKVSVSGLLKWVGYGLLTSGFLQMWVWPDTRFLYGAGWDDHYYRMIGSLFDPNFFGLMMVMTGILVWFFENGKLRMVLMGLTGLALILTFSRLSWLTAMVVWPTMWLGSYRVFAFLPTGEGWNLLRWYSVESRIESISNGWQIFIKNPIVGIGFNNYFQIINKTNLMGQPFHPSAPDNSFLWILATTGMIGFASLVWVLLEWFRSVPIWGKLTLMAILIHSMGNNSLFYPWVFLWIGVISKNKH